MGIVETIDFNNFPKQGDVGQRVKVIFKFDTTQQRFGTIVRDDLEEPFEMIIALDNGQYVRSTECQYAPA